MQYLQKEQNYIDLYDLSTIEECLDYYWALKDGLTKDRNKFKNLTDEQFENEVHKATSYTINVIKGERFRYKKETIDKWINRDKLVQEKEDKTPPPDNIYCEECNSSMKITSNDLQNAYDDNAQMLFMYECVNCKKREAYLEDGTKWKYEPPLCPKCNTPLKSKSKDTKNISITIYSCPNCLYKNKDVFDFKKSKEERIKKDKKDKILLNKYREGFCLDEKTGQEYILSMDRIIAFTKELKEQEEKQKDPAYQKAKNLKKLSVVELEKLIAEALEKEKFIKLFLDKPEIGQHVIIPFTVQDADDTRKDYDSTKMLQKIFRKLLDETNWRLTSEGTTYRLGYVYGRLKGYEREEDLANLMRVKATKDNPVMVNEHEPIY